MQPSPFAVANLKGNRGATRKRVIKLLSINNFETSHQADQPCFRTLHSLEIDQWPRFKTQRNNPRRNDRSTLGDPELRS